MAQFDYKNFNGEVFQQYVDRVPNTKLNELLKSRAVVRRDDLKAAMADQTGGNYITTPLLGLIKGSTPLNYDGQTDITSQNTRTFTHSRVVVGRAQAWTEKDFSYDITGGVDFMENVANQVAEYWDDIDQDTIVAELTGIFNMSDTAGSAFVASHTYDITSQVNTEGDTGKPDATTLNTGMQKACGDHKGKFSLAIMHSAVATHYENMNLLTYLKYNDENGMQRDTSMGTINGRLVLVDDSMPSEDVIATAGVYTLQITTAATAGDTFNLGGVALKWVANGTTAGANEINLPSTNNATNEATALYTYLAALTSGPLANYTWTNPADGKVTATQKAVGYQKPAFSVGTSGTFAGTVTEDTASVETKNYTTFVFGDGAIEYTNCGAKVPSAMARDEKTAGGQDTLYSRQRKCFAPYGINFTMASMESLSPTNAELKMGANWKLVNSGGENPAEYIDAKAIPIMRVISRA